MTLQHIQFAGAEGQRLAIRIGMHQQRAELVLLFIRHQAQPPGTGRAFAGLGGHHASFSFGPTPRIAATHTQTSS